MRNILLMVVVMIIASCSPYENNEFTSCADYTVRSFSHEQAPVAISLPADWDLDIGKTGDSLRVMATDEAYLEENGSQRIAGFLQYPSRSGYRKHLPTLLRSLHPGTATLVSESGLIRINGIAMEYIIGNDALNSTFLLAYESPEASTTVLLLGQIDRKDDPILADFCYLGPVLEEFVRVHFNPRS